MLGRVFHIWGPVILTENSQICLVRKPGRKVIDFLEITLGMHISHNEFGNNLLILLKTNIPTKYLYMLYIVIIFLLWNKSSV